jgi:hypothetical protein
MEILMILIGKKQSQTNPIIFSPQTCAEGFEKTNPIPVGPACLSAELNVIYDSLIPL